MNEIPEDILPNVTYNTSHQTEQIISGNKNVAQKIKGDNNINVGVVEGSLTINYRRPIDRPFQAPRLPSNFVDRPSVSLELKARLLADTSSGTRALLISAIHGLGGIGKTILATALAHDKGIQKHFTSGVLWATLGQEPDILSLLSGWVQALGDYDFRAINIEATSAHLRTLLHDKAVLLVVDDAWEADHVEPFLVASSQSQVLITSRRADVADKVGASLQQLNVMTPEESLALLSQFLERQLEGIEKQGALQVAETVGYLPIALNLAAARVKRGVTWAKLETDLKAEVARLEVLEGPRKKEETTLEASFNLSLKVLREYSERAWENFIWLGVLPEDVTIAAPMAVTLWEMQSPDEANEHLELLWNDALLQSISPVTVAREEWKSYKIHDLLHDVARRLLIASPSKGIGLTLLQAHTNLLSRYQNKTQNQLWYTLEDDGYIHAHLTWHFQQANQLLQIHQLLEEETSAGGNGWYEACDRLGQTANFVADVARAWQLAEDSWTETTQPQVIGLQCRYALIIASLNSLAANLPVELLIALVQKNVWTPEQGLAYVLQSSNPEQKANLLTELVNHLPPNLEKLGLSKALAAAREIQDEWHSAQALRRLADKLPPDLLSEALAAGEIRSDWYRASVISSLVPLLPPDLLPEALTAARNIQSESSRIYPLSNLAVKLPELLPETIAATREIQDESNRAYALSSLVVKLPELLPEALAAAREIQDESNRAYALSSLADKLPPDLLSEALAAAREIKSESNRVKALSSLADKLPPELLPEALAAAREIKSEKYRADALSSLVVKLPELLPEALAAVRKNPDARDRVLDLRSLADKLPQLLPEALATAINIQDDYYRAYALRRLADKLPPDLLPKALATAINIQDEEDRADTLSSLAHKLPPDLLPKALAAAREIQNDYYRAGVLSSLANKAPELLPEALAAARNIQFNVYRAYALSSLADKLPELLPEALAATREIQDEYFRAKALSSLADKLPQLLPRVLATTRNIQNEYSRIEVLSSLFVKLPPDLLPETLAAVREIQDESNRVKALSSLADKLPLELLPEALAATREIQDEYSRAQILSSLADKLLPELLPEALAAARNIQNEYSRAQTLSNLADKLPPELLPEALAAAREIQDESSRAKALNGLANKLPLELLPEALAAAREIQSEYSRIEALSSLADKLPELLPEALALAIRLQSREGRTNALSSLTVKLSQLPKNQLFSLWRDNLHILSLRTRQDLLSEMGILTPVIFALGGEQAVKDTASAIQDVSRWWS
ncbi:NB-ARC domain-containing protein [Anabaena sp. FACHB-83]|uniref:NB-ARC domain-containing protein n=1 Tax=Anabaena sp. FACHB-83 TaxID=2692772 RepID=UPI00168AC6CC|nr:NB-ARC domain-containing protein [Anabaena sp. FACHB-83]MBD2479777.1 hypothetical protein [Anabaena sp. FACHB-83]